MSLIYENIKDFSKQVRLNPKAIDSLAPHSICSYCGSAYTKRNFKDICPECETVENILLDKEQEQKQIKQTKLW